MAKTHILGFPRIGAKRELKKALESYWNAEISEEQLRQIGARIRQQNWKIQADAGLDFVTVGDFSFYDHVLDTSILLGVIPPRYQHDSTQEVSLDTLFLMARGQIFNKNDVPALAMTKWFNTNYHYLVPEFELNQDFSLSSTKLFDEIIEAQSFGYNVKPVILGPLSYLWLGRGNDFNKLDLVDNIIEIYSEIMRKLDELKIQYVQIDEPILTLDLDEQWSNAYKEVYRRLANYSIEIILTTYFDDLGNNLKLVKQLPISGLHIDVCSNPRQLTKVANEWSCKKILSVGIINGQNVWKNDLNKSFNLLSLLKDKFGDNLWVSSSCSLLHVPVDLQYETALGSDIKNWLAFAVQKIEEISILGKGVNYSKQAIQEELAQNLVITNLRSESRLIYDQEVQDRIISILSLKSSRNLPFNERIAIQEKDLSLPLFPTTTIGSFPQTSDIRKVRRQYKSGIIDENTYIDAIKEEIKLAIEKQEEVGLDVLVHGEAERNDMVEYFGEELAGFAFTNNGWVQSYGSRCVKPPIIYGDVKRKSPITVNWIKYAQSLTTKPVKGMLTGPVTILSWSFVRDDQPLKETAFQIALALREEVSDLEEAGIKIIQIDEPAFREGLPLKRSNWQEYLDWAIYSFKITSSVVNDSTQIHTHMCYSSFNDIIEAIAELDADVITIETSRGNLELLKVFESFNYPNQIGPGVYDIHSPRIPNTEEIIDQINKMTKYIRPQNLWINPDCGLKTRSWTEVMMALKNMQKAVYELRKSRTLIDR